MALSSLKSSLSSASSSLKSAASSAASRLKSTASSARTTSSRSSSSLSSGLSRLKSTASSARATASRSSSSLSSGLSSLGSSLKSTASNVKSSTSSSGTTSKITSGLSNLGSTIKRNLGTTSSSSGSLLSNLTNKVTNNTLTKIGKTSPAVDKLSISYLTNKTNNGSIINSITSAIKGSTNTGTSTLSNLISKYSSNSTGTGLLSNLKNRITTSTTGGTSILSSLTSAFNPNSTSKYNVSNAISTLKNNIQSRTGGTGVLSNLFSNAKGLINKDGTGVSKITNLNVFGGLKNLITNVKSNITGGDGTSRIDTMGVLGLSTKLGGAAERIQNSFDTWKGKINSLLSEGGMSGIISGSVGEAESKMNELFGNFHGYAKEMASRLLGISEDTLGVDSKLSEMFSSSSTDGEGVLGAVERLDGSSGVSGKYDINNPPGGQYDRNAQKERSVILANYLVENGGFTKEQAAAMVGVYWDENGCYPGEVMQAEKKANKKSYGAGVASWTDQDYKNKCLKAAGLPANTPIESLTMKQQADMIIAMSQTGENKTYYDALKRCDNIEDASATAVVITGGVGFSNNWKTHPTQAEAKQLSNWYANRNDSKYGYSDYHHNLDTRRLDYAKEIYAAMD